MRDGKNYPVAVRAELLFVLLVQVLVLGCQELRPGGATKEADPKNASSVSYYQEKQLSFSHLRNGYKPGMDWIKDSKVLFTVHESLHNVGYLYLNEHFQLSSFVDIQKPQLEWIDSLVLTREKHLEAPKYYREFWQRRIADGNDEVVFRIVEEVKEILIDSAELEFFPEMVNDTLVNLIGMEIPLEDRAAADPDEDLQLLIDYGLHQSAHNIRTGQRANYDKVKWKLPIDSILPKLRKVDEYQPAWLEDDTK